jgi:hypothetical protein
MAHTHPTKKPSPTDLVLLRFAVPSKMATSTSSEVFIRTCAESVIRIPKTLLKTDPPNKKSNHILFEARVPRDVAAVVRSIYAELFRLTHRGSTGPGTNQGK